MERAVDVYTSGEAIAAIQKKIDRLSELQAADGDLVYIKPDIPPVNRNAATGQAYTDMNRLTIDLEAGKASIMREIVINGASAGLIGLVLEHEISDVPDPDGCMLVFENISTLGAPDASPHYEYVYFADIFDRRSILTAVNAVRNNTEDSFTRKSIRTVARRFAGLISDYDSGKYEQDEIREHKTAVKENYHTGRSVSAYHSWFVRGMSNNEKQVFEYMRKWFSNQNAGRKLFVLDPSDLTAGMAKLAGQGVRFSDIAFDAGMFAELTSCRDMDPAYVQNMGRIIPALLSKIKTFVSLAKEKGRQKEI